MNQDENYLRSMNYHYYHQSQYLQFYQLYYYYLYELYHHAPHILVYLYHLNNRLRYASHLHSQV